MDSHTQIHTHSHSHKAAGERRRARRHPELHRLAHGAGSRAARPSVGISLALGAVVAASLFAPGRIVLRATAHGPEDVLVLFVVGAALLTVAASASAPALRRAT